jgi:ABC-type hemin transport system ATPase subunit
MRAVMEVSDSIFVIAAGRLIAHGPPHEVVHQAAVIEAYLGKPLTPGDRDAAAVAVALAPDGAAS